MSSAFARPCRPSYRRIAVTAGCTGPPPDGLPSHPRPHRARRPARSPAARQSAPAYTNPPTHPRQNTAVPDRSYPDNAAGNSRKNPPSRQTPAKTPSANPRKPSSAAKSPRRTQLYQEVGMLKNDNRKLMEQVMGLGLSECKSSISPSQSQDKDAPSVTARL